MGAQLFKTQLDAVAFLSGSGFKVAKSKFNNDVRSGRVGKNGDGFFEEGALLAYAAVHLSPVAAVEDKRANEAARMRLSADADLKAVQAERMRLKLEVEQGRYLPREDHDLELSKRAQFFRNEVENSCYQDAPEIIAVCGGDEANLEKLQRFLLTTRLKWLDAYSRDMEFVIETGERQGDDGRSGADA